MYIYSVISVDPLFLVTFSQSSMSPVSLGTSTAEDLHPTRTWSKVQNLLGLGSDLVHLGIKFQEY